MLDEQQKEKLENLLLPLEVSGGESTVGEDVLAAEASNASETKEGSTAEKAEDINLAEQAEQNFSCDICDFCSKILLVPMGVLAQGAAHA